MDDSRWERRLAELERVDTLTLRQSQLASHNAEKRRVRLAIARSKGTHTAEQWNMLLRACGPNCVRCGQPFGPAGPQKDHILPLYRGGSDGLDNLQPLCVRCNGAKAGEDVDHRPPGVLQAMGGE